MDVAVEQLGKEGKGGSASASTSITRVFVPKMVPLKSDDPPNDSKLHASSPSSFVFYLSDM